MGENMAHFYGSVAGSAVTEATRCGSVNSGISAHIRGWGSGVEIIGRQGPDGNDVFSVYATSGSNNQCGRQFIGTIHSAVDEKGAQTVHFLSSGISVFNAERSA